MTYFWETFQTVLIALAGIVGLYGVFVAKDVKYGLEMLAIKCRDQRPPIHQESAPCACKCGRNIRKGKLVDRRAIK